jgi:uncharacterized membrane protein YhhN
MNWILSIAIFFSAFMTIRAYYVEPRQWAYLFKPLTMVLILLLAWLAPMPAFPAYRTLVLVGLMLSLAGDVFLMLPGDYFLPGLVSFLAAHIAYVVAFGTRAGWQFSWVALFPFLVVGVVMWGVLRAHLGKMKMPAFIYILAILLMGWQATNAWIADPTPLTLLGIIGAVIFMVSDSALSINRFRTPFHWAQLVVLGTYFVAQWLIALSIG